MIILNFLVCTMLIVIPGVPAGARVCSDDPLVRDFAASALSPRSVLVGVSLSTNPSSRLTERRAQILARASYLWHVLTSRRFHLQTPRVSDVRIGNDQVSFFLDGSLVRLVRRGFSFEWIEGEIPSALSLPDMHQALQQIAQTSPGIAKEMLESFVERVSSVSTLKPAADGSSRQDWLTFFQTYRLFLEFDSDPNDVLTPRIREMLLRQARRLDSSFFNQLSDLFNGLAPESFDVSPLLRRLETLLSPHDLHANWASWMDARGDRQTGLALYDVVSRTRFDLEKGGATDFSRDIHFVRWMSEASRAPHDWSRTHHGFASDSVPLESVDAEAARWTAFLLRPQETLTSQLELDQAIRSFLWDELSSLLKPHVLEKARLDPQTYARVRDSLALFLAYRNGVHHFWRAYETLRLQGSGIEAEPEQQACTAAWASMGYFSELPRLEWVVFMLPTLNPDLQNASHRAALQDFHLRAALLDVPVSPTNARIKPAEFLLLLKRLSIEPEPGVHPVSDTSRRLLDHASLPSLLRVRPDAIRVQTDGIDLRPIWSDRRSMTAA